MKYKYIAVVILIWVIISASASWLYFGNEKKPFVFMEGKALGVFYAIAYQGDASLESKLDSLINSVDLALNTTRPDSDISKFNRNGYIQFRSPFLYQVLTISQEYSNDYKGAVNHMLLPLIQAWGQDFSNKRQMTAEKIEELKQLCQAKNMEITPQYIRGIREGVMINLSYIDKGFLIDLLTDFLLKQDIKNFQIEFGTDAVSYGKSSTNTEHRLVIIHPEGSNETKSIIKETKLKNMAYSSSGNFEKFYVDEQGLKHSHLIDPRTGRPIDNKILSAHIKAPTCLHADAMATICMILTLEESSKLILENPDLEGFIVYNEKGRLQTWKSPGFEII